MAENQIDNFLMKRSETGFVSFRELFVSINVSGNLSYTAVRLLGKDKQHEKRKDNNILRYESKRGNSKNTGREQPANRI